MFQGTAEGLLVQAVTDELAIQCRLPGVFTAECIAVPYDALMKAEARSDMPVRISVDQAHVLLRWDHAGVPYDVRSPIVETAVMPDAAETLKTISSSFIRAMTDAVDTSATESGRYALSKVCLSGTDGRIIASDGRQALLQEGFEFPWTDELLVPATRAFTAQPFKAADTVMSGCTDDWVSVNAGDWTLQLRIDRESRFPMVDDLIPATDEATTSVFLSDDDAAFLLNAAKRLPTRTKSDPVTMDLNGAVTIRTREQDSTEATEIILNTSTRTGEELRFNTDSAMLLRAVRLGFHAIHFRSSESPAFCRANGRSFVWALCSSNDVIEANSDAVRMESPVSSVHHPPNRISSSMTSTKHKPRSKPTTSDDTITVLTKAEALRDSLSRTLADVRELISTIKRDRKQNRLVQSTLRSLRQLENIGS